MKSNKTLHYAISLIFIPVICIILRVKYLMYAADYWHWSWDIGSPYFGLHTIFHNSAIPYIDGQNEELILPVLISLIFVGLYWWLLNKKTQ